MTAVDVLAVAARVIVHDDELSRNALADMFEDAGMPDEARDVRGHVMQPPEEVAYTYGFGADPATATYVTVRIRARELVRRIAQQSRRNRNRRATSYFGTAVAGPANRADAARTREYLLSLQGAPASAEAERSPGGSAEEP